LAVMTGRSGIAPARTHLVVSILAGCAVAAGVSPFAPWEIIPAAGWGAAACLYVAWVWITTARLDAEETARLATREDPGRAATDALLLAAGVSSLAEVGFILSKAGGTHGGERTALVASSVASVVLSWALIHTLFALRYARMYYGGTPGGIDFGDGKRPTYLDFAYVAFTIGMTFQVSDTDLQTREFRVVALRHALLSFLFGAVILATTINLVAGLSR
jgi:uncharacterized membrane protein